MAVETSAVQITINVTDANSGAVIAGVEQNLNKLGSAGATSGQKVAQSMDGVSKSLLSATEQTRLTTEVMGVRLPRAMISLISQSKLAQAALGAIGGAMIGLASIQIGVMIFDAAISGAKKFYEKWLDVDGAIRRYNDEAGQAASKKFYEDAGLDQLNADLLKANQQLDQLNQKRINSPKADMGPSGSQFATPGIYKVAHLFGASTPEHFGVPDAKAQGELQDKNDAAHLKLIDETHRKTLQQIGDAKLIAEARVTGIAKAREAQNAENKKADEDRSYAQARAAAQAEIANRGIDNSRTFGNLKPGDKGYREAVAVSPDTGNAENAEAKTHAAAEFQAQQFEIGREHSHELARLREQALEAGLRGIALYKAQESAAIDELKFKDMDSVDARNYIHEKFHKEEMKRLEDQRRETEKIERTAALAGSTGIAKIQGEGNNRVADLNADQTLDPDQRARRVAAAQKETNAQIAVEQRTFSEQVDSIVERSQSHQISGFERIRVEAEKASNDLQKQFDKAHELMDLRQPGAQAALDQDTDRLGVGLNAISAGAAGQSSDLSRKNAEETSQIEAQARSKLLSAEKNQTAAIEIEYEQRLQKYKEERDKEGLSQDDYNRRVLAADELKNAQLVEAAQRAREKMAGEFSRFFSNPLSAMKEMGNKAAGEAAAALMQRAQNKVGGAGGAAQGGPGGGIFDRIAGVATGRSAGTSGTATHSAASAMISVGTAQISIGGASLALGGAGSASSGTRSAGSSAASGFSTSGGSTGLLASVGGASEPGGSTAAPMSFSGSTSAGGAPSSGGVGAALGNTQKGMGMFSQGKSMLGGLFGRKGATSDAGAGLAETEGTDLSGTFDKDGNFNPGKGNANGGMLGGGGVGANAMGAAGGAMGMYSAIEGNGGVGGALGGAMSGMQLGMAIGGPMGAAVGAAAGAIIGAIGFGGKEKARVYDLKTVRPRIAADTLGYQQGTMDYSSAYSDMQSLDMEARKALKAMGQFGDRYYWDTVNGEIKQAEGKLTAEQRAGRSNYTAQAAQYDVGADSVPRDGLAMIHENERIMPSDQNERITRAIEGGADGTKMAAQSQSGWGGDIHIHAIDAKSSVNWLMANKHNVRAAMNSSYGENSGGADA